MGVHMISSKLSTYLCSDWYLEMGKVLFGNILTEKAIPAAICLARIDDCKPSFQTLPIYGRDNSFKTLYQF
jgi:hypothetical protein